MCKAFEMREMLNQQIFTNCGLFFSTTVVCSQLKVVVSRVWANSGQESISGKLIYPNLIEEDNYHPYLSTRSVC